MVLKIYNTVCPLAPLGTSKIKRCRKRNLGNCGNFGASPLGVSDAAPFFGACGHPFPLPLSWTLGPGLLERAEIPRPAGGRTKTTLPRRLWHTKRRCWAPLAGAGLPASRVGVPLLRGGWVHARLIGPERGTAARRFARISVRPGGGPAKPAVIPRRPRAALLSPRPDGASRGPGAGEWACGAAVPCDPAPLRRSATVSRRSGWVPLRSGRQVGGHVG